MFFPPLSTRRARVSVTGVPHALVRAAPCVRSRPGRTRCARPRALRRRRASRSVTPRNAVPARAPKPSAAEPTGVESSTTGQPPFRPRAGPRISADPGKISQFVNPRCEKSAKVPRLHLLPAMGGVTRTRRGGARGSSTLTTRENSPSGVARMRRRVGVRRGRASATRRGRWGLALQDGTSSIWRPVIGREVRGPITLDLPPRFVGPPYHGAALLARRLSAPSRARKAQKATRGGHACVKRGRRKLA